MLHQWLPAKAKILALQRNVTLKPPSSAAVTLRRGRRSVQPCAVILVAALIGVANTLLIVSSVTRAQVLPLSPTVPHNTLNVSAIVDAKQLTPTVTPQIELPAIEPCHSGSGWTWTYGPSRPDIAAKVQQTLSESGPQTSVEVWSFGETDSCGKFELYALDFNIKVNNVVTPGAAETSMANKIQRLLVEFGKPNLGKVKLTFASTGDTLDVSPHLEGRAGSYSTPTSSSLSGISLPLKVYVLVFDPVLSNSQTLSQYMNWTDYNALAQGTVNEFQQTSNNWVNYTIVYSTILTNTIEAWPLKVDGFRYTEAEYLAVINHQTPPHSPDSADYNHILNLPVLDIIGKLNRGEIDELWMYGAPYFGYYESRLVGPGAYWYNSPPVPEPSGTNRLMPIMGFSYERLLAEAIHDFGHRTEATMSEAYGSWQENSTLHNWDRFALVKAQSPAYFYSGCGDTHYPPNGTSDYDYGNLSTVLSNCDDFAHYPHLGDPLSTTLSVTCSAWGCGHKEFLEYWFSHLPKYYGCGPDAVANSWWTYFAYPMLALDPLAACALSPGVRLSGPMIGAIYHPLVYTATVSPISVTLPITYIWQATEQPPVIHVSNNLTDTITFTWAHTGTNVVTVTAIHAEGVVTDTRQILITPAITTTFQIGQSSDDAGPEPDGCTYSFSWNEIYVGKCANGQDITSGYRFANVTIPQGSQVLYADVEFTVDGTYANELNTTFYGEATGNAQTFSGTNKPENRSLTGASTAWSILAGDVWGSGQTRHSPDLTGIVQEIVNRLDWRGGNALAIITQNAGATNPSNSHRRIFAYERYPAGAARLTVTYIEESALAADFYATPITGAIPLTVTFANTSAGSITQNLWDFGDDVTSTLASPTHTYTSVGVYTVTLTVNGPGGSDTLTRTNYITIYTPAHASFSALPTTGIAPQLVVFTNTSNGDYTTSLWNFGDGVTSTLQSPTHIYSSAGNYTVTLTISGMGGTDVLTQANYITLFTPSHAGFSVLPTTGIAPQLVTFTNTSTGDYTTSLWNFGDGLSSVVNSPTHTYSAAANYTVTLTVNGPGGSDTLTRTNYITIYTPAHASFSALPTTGIAPQLVVFTNTSNGDYTTSLWNFGDGVTSTLQSPTHIYSSAGNYTVTLTISGMGGTDVLTQANYITLFTPSHAGFSVLPTTGIAPQMVTFTNTSTGDYTTSLWNFGDGLSSVVNSPTHTYSTAGNYTVTLTISGMGGTDVLTQANYITLFTPSHAGFSALPTTGIAPQMVTFTNTSTGDYTTSLWNFGDGLSSIVNSPTHTYSAAANYTVTLTVNGPGGSDTLTRTNYITIRRPCLTYLPIIMKAFSR